MSYTYEHPRPSVTVDSVVLHYRPQNLKILFIKRNGDPFKGCWALPGGFLDMDEAPEEGVKRELKEETGLEVEEVLQIGAFGNPNRDPRGRVISICFLTVLKSESVDGIEAASDASDARWFNIHELPEELAFDHDEIIGQTLKVLKEKLKLSIIDHSSLYDLKTDDIIEINKML